MSSTTRKHITELSAVLRRRFAEYPFGTSLYFRKLLQDVRANSDRVCSRHCR